MNCTVRKGTHALVVALLVTGASHPATAQMPSTTAPVSCQQPSGQDELAGKIDKMMSTLESMQRQLHDSRQEIDELRVELKIAESNLGGSAETAPGQTAAELQSSVEQLKDDDQILQSEVKQHDQVKVETISKYPIQLNGMLLFTSFLNDGAVNDIDTPGIALTRNAEIAHGSLSATVRQTVLGLRATGPHLGGAASSADLSVDFFAGIPSTAYATSAGLLRLRTAHASLDWEHNSLKFALDKPLLSHGGPTSFLSVGEPPLSWSGNLWIWSPQIIWNGHRTGRWGALDLQAGLIDPPAPEMLDAGPRQPDAAERSRTPGYESRVGYKLDLEGRELDIGTGGYYSRQTYPYDHHIDAWSATMDWRLDFSKQLEFSGALYRGRAIAGLGGAFQDYVVNTDTKSYRGLNAEGGWSQMKWRITRSIETNGAIGQASSFARDLDFAYPAGTGPYATLARNRTIFGNIIYHPKTYLVFSAEYRKIRSWPLTGDANASQSLGLGAGYLF